jgi:hypothetical protein
MKRFDFATQKDLDRADNLNWRGRTFHPMGGDIAIANAKTMAKLIKCPRKILSRFEAVAHRWDNPDILRPFIARILELHPNSRYSAAFNSGVHNGRYSMSPGRPYGGEDSVENMLYGIGHSLGRRGEGL